MKAIAARRETAECPTACDLDGSSHSLVVSGYDGLVVYLDTSWFLMRPPLNGGTLADGMGIDVQLRQHDEVLAEAGDPKMVLSRAAGSTAFTQTRLLKYLAPWGDAIFNQAQADA